MKIILILVALLFSVATSQATNIQINHVPIPFGETYMRMGAFNNNTISAISGKCILRSTDKGSSWSSINYMFIDSTIRFEGIAAKGRIGFAVANVWVSQSFIWKRCVLRTTNSGQSWSELENAPSINQMNIVEYDGATLIVGSWISGKYSISYNNGNSWQAIQILPVTTGGKIQILIDGQNLMFMYYNTLYKSTNGITWSDSTYAACIRQNITALAKTNQGLMGVGYLDSNGHFPVVNRNALDNTFQILIQPPWSGEMSDIKFVTSRIGFMCGTVGYPGFTRALLYKTINGGTTWSIILDTNITISNHTNSFHQISINGNTAYITGGNIEVTVNDVMTNTGEGQGQVEDYNLQQNFPNPFNPETKINFSLPKSSFVDLKVYNSIGKEVATLMHETKAAGEQGVTFNGANLSSGVYFYKLTTDSFTDTKKMVLAK